MATTLARVQIPLSAKAPVKGAQVAGDINPGDLIDVTVRLRRRVPAAQFTAATQNLASLVPSARGYLSRSAFIEQYGADPADLEKIKAFASHAGLAVTEESLGRRSVHLRGTVAVMNSAFGIDLKTFQHPRGEYRGRPGSNRGSSSAGSRSRG